MVLALAVCWACSRSPSDSVVVDEEGAVVEVPRAATVRARAASTGDDEIVSLELCLVDGSARPLADVGVVAQLCRQRTSDPLGCFLDSPDLFWDVRTDASGRLALGIERAARYESDLLSGSTLLLLHSDDGALPLGRRRSACLHLEIDGRLGRVDLGSIELRRPPVVLAGTVSRADGAALAGCSIRLSEGHGPPRGLGRKEVIQDTISTDEAGRFEVCAWIREDSDLVLEVHASPASGLRSPRVLPGLEVGDRHVEVTF